MNMKQEGSVLNKTDIEAILNGEFVPKGEISEHILIHKLAELLSYCDQLLDLQEEFDKGTLFKLFRFLAEEEGQYRKTTPVLVHLGYSPVLPQEIDESLDILFRQISAAENKDSVEKAVMLHDGIMRIYPFRQWNEIIGRTALEYALLYYGEDFCPVTLSEQEYNRAITEAVRTGENKSLISNMRMNLLMRNSMD